MLQSNPIQLILNLSDFLAKENYYCYSILNSESLRLFSGIMMPEYLFYTILYRFLPEGSKLPQDVL